MQESMPASAGASAQTALLASPPVDLEALKGSLMSEIEAKLSKKEDDLWKRGQFEIKRLQQEQEKVKESIGSLQQNQDSLLKQNKEIRGALLQVTSSFESVVKEMREALRALPQQHAVNLSTAVVSHVQPSPSPSVASTSASEALRDELSPDSIYEPTVAGSSEKASMRTTPLTAARDHQSPGASGKKSAASELQREVEKELSGGTFCTPPRNDGSQDSALDAVPPASPPVLSLANSLPPAANSPKSSPACKLQLAECLTGGQSSNIATSSAVIPPPPSSPSVRQADSSSSTFRGLASVSSAKQFDFVKIELIKESGFVTLGIEVNQEDGVSLRVEKIDNDGLVGRHNARLDARSESRVQLGDRVIEVNGIRQDPNSMLQECKARQHLLFTISRDSLPTQMTRKASSDGDSSADDASGQAASSPTATKMRPEASVFVPASHAAQEAQSAPPLVLPAVAVVPPGFESYDSAGLLTLPTGPALGTQFASMLEAAAVGMHGHPSLPPPPLGMPMVAGSPGYDEDEEVKRALFR